MKVHRRIGLSYFHVAVFLVLLHPSFLFGQGVEVRASVDSNHITMGDWLNLTVQVKHAPAIGVEWSQYKDSLGGFEIVRQDSLGREESNGSVTETKKFTLSKYDSGSFSIPPVLIAYRSADDTTIRYVKSDPLNVDVATIQVDTAKAIKDIKPPLSIPLTWKEIAAYSGIALLIIALIVGAYFYYKKKMKKREDVVEESVPRIPPHTEAIIRLKELQEKRVWQQGNVKAFYSEATEIIRQYFERRYSIKALEMTSDEIFGQLRGSVSLEADAMKEIESFFINADLVKFAKYTPVPSDNEAVIPQGLSIVERTRQREEVPQNV